jgi:hypothetical protein
MKTRVVRATAATALIFALAGCAKSPNVTPVEPSTTTPMTPAAGKRQGTLGPPMSRCAENFSIFDRDRDARVSLEELADALEPGINPDLLFRERDRDSDGYLTENEFCARIGVTTKVAEPFPN